MSEVVTSILNKNSLLYGNEIERKYFGPDRVDGKGEEYVVVNVKPTGAPIKTIWEK